MVFAAATIAQAGDEASKPPISAPKAVREGNLLLKAGDAASALEHYRQAETAQPSAREIAFDRGLGHYALSQFDEARQAFEKAAGGAGDALADDAVYSAGACDHAEALANAANPKAALSKLENAMQRYQSVLSRRPEHQPARDANYKAASMWRELKQKLEQQKQQQPQNDQQDQNQQDENQEKQQSSEQQKENEQQERQSAQDQQQQQSQEKQEEKKQQSVSAEQQDNQDEQSKEAQAKEEEQKEDVSREQAERKLREMMQALRDRKKLRRQEVKRIPISPVDKDW